MKKVFLYFILWKIYIFIILLISFSILPLQSNYLGGGLTNYLKNPFIWSFVNFDGEHFLSIALEGYKPLNYFYFPLFPLIVGFFSNLLLAKSFQGTAFLGIFLSNLFFLVALFGIYKLLLMDYKKAIVERVIFLILIFPTSFYFGNLYSESLFLALVVWVFYFARKGIWFWAGLLAALSTATRLVGLAIFPSLIFEAYFQSKCEKKKFLFPFICSFFSLTGIILYMVYLKIKTGDPLEFFHSVGIFGQQRSSTFILLPQVFYRYFFKILPNLNYSYLPVVFTTYLEIVVALIFGFLVFLSFFKIRVSYAIYSMIAYILPTLSGSFSSFPRYVLVIFPAFIMMSLYFAKFTKLAKFLIILILVSLLALFSSLFFRGYWVS